MIISLYLVVLGLAVLAIVWGISTLEKKLLAIPSCNAVEESFLKIVQTIILPGTALGMGLIIIGALLFLMKIVGFLCIVLVIWIIIGVIAHMRRHPADKDTLMASIKNPTSDQALRLIKAVLQGPIAFKKQH